MADLVGPFYSADSVIRLLNCDPSDLRNRAADGQLLEVHTADGVSIFPTFQFTPAGAVRTELIPVLVALKDVPRWSTAVWLRTPNRDLDGTTPEQALNDPGWAGMVQTIAQHRAADLTG